MDSGLIGGLPAEEAERVSLPDAIQGRIAQSQHEPLRLTEVHVGKVPTFHQGLNI